MAFINEGLHINTCSKAGGKVVSLTFIKKMDRLIFKRHCFLKGADSGKRSCAPAALSALILTVRTLCMNKKQRGSFGKRFYLPIIGDQV